MKTTGKFRIFIWLLLAIGVVAAAAAGVKTYQLSIEIRSRFDGEKWPLPAVVYARPMELYPGLNLTPQMLEKELLLCGYRREKTVMAPGGFLRTGFEFTIMTREFTYPSGHEESKSISVYFDSNGILRIIDNTSFLDLPFVRIDPARIGSFHPLVHEDRVVVKPDEVPEIIKQALIAVEDRNFYNHHGISIRGIVRALLANIRAGHTVQGGSTLTQQLVKNFFLNNERTLSRKVREAVMAALLEFHYSKDEILTAYVNEVFLGQDGSRAVHGFGLASQFYFRRSLKDLSVAQAATLVGMIKGPTLYDPRRNPEKCLVRRADVLDKMLAEHVIDNKTHNLAMAQPLTDVNPLKHGVHRFPAFVELVRRQLIKEYKEADLRGSGLQILTTLDPLAQLAAEKQVKQTLALLEKDGRRADVEGAVIITARETGEVQAVIGGRDPRLYGFNRALDARRAIGSLIKPVVYLTALTKGYTLASPLNDVALTVENSGNSWHPRNYDGRQHGRVGLFTALAKSYNLATVHLGMELGLSQVTATLKQLGHNAPVQPYPSMLLGTTAMSPLQVAQLYQTIASGGFYLPLRSIRAVIGSDGRLLTRYGLEVEQRFAPETMYLLNHNLIRVVEEGTGQSSSADGFSFAGKTGTTDELRDSWFAGFSGDRLAVVWLGNDDNKSISLSGSSGALRVWGAVMRAVGAINLELAEPPGIMWRRIDRTTLERATIFNRNSTVLPFVKESQ